MSEPPNSSHALDKIAQDLLRPITGVITLAYAGRPNAFKASDAAEWLGRKYDFNALDCHRILKQLKKTHFVESLGMVLNTERERDEWLVSCLQQEELELDRKPKKTTSGRFSFLTSSSRDAGGKEKDKEKDKEKEKEKSKDKDKDKEKKRQKIKRSMSHVELPPDGRGVNVNLTTALLSSAIASPRSTPSAIASEDSILAISGGGNINKISKLIGHQTISTTEAVEHSKLAKLLGANVKEAAEQIPITLSSAKPSAAVKHAVEASALEPHKLLKRGKQPTRFPLSIVPQKLDTNLNSMHQIEILRGGYVVAQYKNTGTLGIADSDKNTIFFLKNESPVINVCFRFPYLLSLHTDGHLQVYDISTDKTKYYACADTPDAIESVLGSLSNITGHSVEREECRGSLLLVDGIRVVVVRAFATKYKVHVWHIQHLETAHRRMSFSRSGRAPPIGDIPQSRSDPALDSSQLAILASSSSAFLAPSFDPLAAQPTITLLSDLDDTVICPIIPCQGHCRIEGDRILLANFAEWQMWELTTGRLLSHASGDDGEDHCIYNFVQWSGDYVAAATTDRVLVWSILEAKKLYTVRCQSAITTLLCDLCGITYGDRDGNITVRSHSVSEKVLLSTEEALESTDLLDSLAGDGFGKKVNFVVKKGDDLLVAAREDGSLCYWHIPSSSLVKMYSTNGQIVSLVSDDIHIMAIAKQKPEKDTTKENHSEALPVEIWIFPLQWLERWAQERPSQIGVAKASSRFDNMDDRKRSFVRKKNKSSDHLAVDSSTSSKLHKVLGQGADAPIGGGANKKLLQVLGADVLIRPTDSKQSPTPKLRKSDKKLSAKLLRASRFVPLHIPEALTNKFALLTKTALLNPGLAASVYRDSGSILLSGNKGGVSTEVSNPSPIVSYVFQAPYAFTVHRNSIVQILHVDSRTRAQYRLHRRTIQRLRSNGTEETVGTTTTHNHSTSPSALDEAIDDNDNDVDDVTIDEMPTSADAGGDQRELAVTIVCDSSGERVLIVKTFELHHIVWDFAINTTDHSLRLVRRVLLTPPEATPAETGTGLGSPSRRASNGLLKPLDTHSAAASKYILIGNTMEYQVWDLDMSNIVRSHSAPMKSSFVSLNLLLPFIFTVTRDEIVASRIDEVNERDSAVKYRAIITQVLTTPEWIVCGDVDGYVHVLRHGRVGHSIKPQNLAISQPDLTIGDHPAQLVRDSSNAIDRRVTSLAIKGQYVICGHACDCVSVWGFEGNEVRLVKDFSTRGPVLGVAISGNNISALVRGAPTALYSGLELMITNASALLGVDLHDNQLPTRSESDAASALRDEVAQLKESTNTMQILIGELQHSLEDKDRRLLHLRADLEEKTVALEQLIRRDQEKTKRLTAIESRLIAIMTTLGSDFMDKQAVHPVETATTSAPQSPQVIIHQPGSPSSPGTHEDAGSDDDTLV